MVVATSLRLVCQGEHMRGDRRRVRAEHTAVRARRGGAGRGGEGVCNLFAGEAWPPVRGGGAAAALLGGCPVLLGGCPDRAPSTLSIDIAQNASPRAVRAQETRTRGL